jgi:hypothetical protein
MLQNLEKEKMDIIGKNPTTVLSHLNKTFVYQCHVFGFQLQVDFSYSNVFPCVSMFRRKQYASPDKS